MRIISRLDIKSPNLIKGIHLEGLKIIGNPIEIAKNYYKNGVDELLIIDSVASLYDRDPCFELLNRISKNIFCPITIGGGVKDLEIAIEILNSGADKVSLNTHAVRNASKMAALITDNNVKDGTIKDAYKAHTKEELENSCLGTSK